MYGSVRFALLLALTLILGSGVAHAAGPIVSIRPSDAAGHALPGSAYFKLSAARGSDTHVNVLVSNPGAAAVTAWIVPVDATDDAYGGVGYKLPEQPRKAVGSWIHVPETQVRLAPGTGTIVPITVHVPAHARPGVHVGAITAYVPAAWPQSSHFTAIRLQFRTFTAVEVTVPGPAVSALTIKGVSTVRRPDGVYATIDIRNAGNTLLGGRGRIVVTAPGSSRRLISGPFSLDTVLPHTVVHFPIRWAKTVPAGTYRAGVELWSAAGNVRWQGAVAMGSASAPRPAPIAVAAPGASTVSRVSSAPTIVFIAGLAILAAGIGFAAAVLFLRRRTTDKAPAVGRRVERVA